MRRAASLLPLGSAALWITLGACGGDRGTPPVGPEKPDPTPVVDSIWVAPAERTIGVLGTQFNVGAGALAEDGSILYGSTLNPERFSWSSSAPDIAYLSTKFHLPTGNQVPVVVGVSEGTATITATSGGLTGSMTVTVLDRARLAWSVPIPRGIGAGNVMGADGTIYVGTNGLPVDQSVWYAVSPQGNILWTLDLPHTDNTIPAIGDDGTLYLGSWSPGSGGRLIAVNPGGTVRWTLEGLDRIRSAPALGSDGTIYVAGHDDFYAVDPEGEILWTHERDHDVFVFSSPGIASDGTIYVGGEDNLLYAFNPDGSLRWTFETGDRIRSSPSIGADGTIYFGSHDGRLYAVHPDGTERWSVELHCGLPWGCQRVKGSPSISPDGTIYVMVDGVYAVDPGGSVRWSYPTISSSGAAPILGADGTIYIANWRIFALDADGNLLWDYQTKDPAGGSPIIGLDGTIIAAAGQELVAIVEHESTNGGYAGAPWPQVRRDRANSGRAGG